MLWAFLRLFLTYVTAYCVPFVMFHRVLNKITLQNEALSPEPSETAGLILLTFFLLNYIVICSLPPPPCIDTYHQRTERNYCPVGTLCCAPCLSRKIKPFSTGKIIRQWGSTAFLKWWKHQSSGSKREMLVQGCGFKCSLPNIQRPQAIFNSAQEALWYAETKTWKQGARNGMNTCRLSFGLWQKHIFQMPCHFWRTEFLPPSLFAKE